MNPVEFRYLNSHIAAVDVQVGIARLEVPMSVKIADHSEGEFVRVVAKITNDHHAMFEQDIGTYHGFSDEFRNALVWDYVLSLPIKIQNLSIDALLVFTAYRADGSVYGGTSMTFYDENGLLKQGKQKLVFFYGVEGDAKPVRELNSTPGDLYYSEFSAYDHGFKMEKRLESYKVVMMRAQNSIMTGEHDPSNSNGASRNELANDNGMVRQLGLGCGLSLSQLNGAGTTDGVRLDWLDRMVLTQIQHTVGATLTRDRTHSTTGAGTSRGSEGTAGKVVGQIRGNEGGERDIASVDDDSPGNEYGNHVGDDGKRELQLLREIHDVLAHSPGGGAGAKTGHAHAPLEGGAQEQLMESLSFLVVELPLLAHPVVHELREYPVVVPHAPPRSKKEMLSCGFINDAGLLEFSIVDRRFNGRELNVTSDWDYDGFCENLAEEMSRKLTHSSMREKSDASTKPNREQMEVLQRIVDAPHSTVGMARGEKDMLYIFRYSLTDNKKALTKVLLSIDWDVSAEVAQVGPLLELWRAKAPIDVAEALKLLGKEQAFQDTRVRRYAVEILDTATDEEVTLFLLQLVQALRYEPREEDQGKRTDTDLARAARRASEGHFSDDEDEVVDGEGSPGKNSIASGTDGDVDIVTRLSQGQPTGAGGVAAAATAGVSAFISASSSASQVFLYLRQRGYAPTSPLARFLIKRACASRAVASNLYWYLKVETESDPEGLFTSNFYALLLALHQDTSADSGSGTKTGADVGDNTESTGNGNPLLARQLYSLDKWINGVTMCHRDACSDGYKPMFTNKYALIQEQLNASLVERSLIKPPEGLAAVPHPFDPTMNLVAMVTCSKVFRSAMKPCVIDTLAVEAEGENMDRGGRSRSKSRITEGAEDKPFSSLPVLTTSTGSKQGLGKSGDGGVDDDDEEWGMSAGAFTMGESHRHSSDSHPPAPTPTAGAAAATTTTPPIITIGSDDNRGGEVKASARARTIKQRILFKQGDDLRTDQLILNLFSLMDSLLKRVNLDLRMRMYSVLATSQCDGAMEFVDHSAPVQYILDTHNKSIRNYLRKHNPDPSSATGIAADALDTFIRSCAGSCVTTYILGIGDRHLDNIMITTRGQLFHIDFGFVFGKDPKPLPSPFRLTREMAVAIGGENYQNSDNFNRFKAYCFQSYNWLRKSSNLIMNLLSLLNDDTIKSGGTSMAVPDVLKVVEDRLMLHLSEEEAEAHFQSLIDSAINALMPQIVELAHILAMKMK